jgi:hypothetical protein
MLYLSDLAAVLFFVTGLICLKRDRLFAHYAVFVLATLNRETSCF